MTISTIARYAHHTDVEHEARVHGYAAGWDNANYTEAYGVDEGYTGPEVPDRFRHQENVCLEAFQEGEDEFAATSEDEAMYGHDWTGAEAEVSNDDRSERVREVLATLGMSRYTVSTSGSRTTISGSGLDDQKRMRIATSLRKSFPQTDVDAFAAMAEIAVNW